MIPSKAEMLPHFGLTHDPFVKRQIEADLWPSLEVRTAHDLLRYAIRHREIVLVVGDYGVGKTTAIWAALDKLRPPEGHSLVVAEVLGEKRAVTVRAIVEAMLTAFKVERLPAPEAARRRLLRKLLIQRRNSERLAVVIDEAHLIRGGTLKALKELHEQSRHGPLESLFAVILIGHRQASALFAMEAPDFYARLEAHNIVQISGLLPGSAADYLRHRAEAAGRSDLFAPEVLERLEGRHTPLQLNRLAWRLLEAAYLGGGETTITLKTSEALLPPRQIAPEARDIDELLESETTGGMDATGNTAGDTGAAG